MKAKGEMKMTNENELDYVDMTDEQLADYHFLAASENAQITLQLSENCYRRFGKQLLSDAQKMIFRKIADGILPTSAELEILQSEEIASAIKAVKQVRALAIKRSAELGEEYKPDFVLEDKTKGFAVN